MVRKISRYIEKPLHFFKVTNSHQIRHVALWEECLTAWYETIHFTWCVYAHYLVSGQCQIYKCVGSWSLLVIFCSDVVLETRVLVSRRFEDKNESWSWIMKSWSWIFWSWRKSLAVFKTYVDGSEQGTLWHFVRDNKSSLPFGSHCFREPALHAHQPQLRRYLTIRAIC